MIPLLKAEFRKLLTVRSTYIIAVLAFLLLGVIFFYANGYRQVGVNQYWLSSLFGDTSVAIGIFVALIAILLMSHEYRYSTIMYTLTYANSRTKVLLSKVVAVTVFTLGFAVVMAVSAALLYLLGVAISPTAQFVAPEFYWYDAWRAGFFVLAYALLGLVLAALLRHVVGAIASLFIIPTVETLLSLLLRENTKYLPFTTLEQVHSQAVWSAGQAALLFASYLVVAWLVAWYLFLRRDAN